MINAVFALVVTIAAQCTGSACPNPCLACAFQPVTGTNPSVSAWQDLFEAAAERRTSSELPAIQTIETGTARTRTASSFPCRLLPAVAMTESGVAQFCSGSNKTIISFDCGFGVMQVTSGAASYPGLQSRADINLHAGADIMAAKWNGNESFGGHFGDSDPRFIESWYFATWAYNGFVYSNNPNNPAHPAGRAPFHSPGSSPRRDYPYQEIVWGYLEYPADVAGSALFTGLSPTYPRTCAGNVAACCPGGVCRGVPNQSGLFNVRVPLPQPAHIDPCTPSCPPSGCPAADRRDVFLDDKDAGFRLLGDGSAVTVTDEGGFRDRFFTVLPSSPPRVTPRWTATAPSSGRFGVSGFVPLSPASHPAVVVVVTSRGGARRFRLDQSVAGGAFFALGDVELLHNQPFTVELDTQSDGRNDQQRIGIDAFALTWRGDGDVVAGDDCSATIDCAGELLCLDGACSPGCEVTGCSEGSGCQRATGSCVVVETGEGEGEGERGGEAAPGGEGEPAGEGEGEPGGEGEVPGPAPLGSSVNRGCICNTDDDGGGGDVALAATMVGLLAGRRRRR